MATNFIELSAIGVFGMDRSIRSNLDSWGNGLPSPTIDWRSKGYLPKSRLPIPDPLWALYVRWWLLLARGFHDSNPMVARLRPTWPLLDVEA
jgi:hypothetical protein